MNSEENRADLPEETEATASQVVSAAFKVHRELGPGLLESVYEICLAHELRQAGVDVEQQVMLPVRYGNITLESGLRLDLLVERRVVVELKAVDALQAVHKAQVLTYLKLSRYRLGLLINFNVELLKHGMKRIIL